MRFRSLLALTLLPLSAVPKARSADPEALVEAELPSLVTFYEDLHAHPELSLHEELTAAKLAMELKSAGFEVTSAVYQARQSEAQARHSVRDLERGVQG